MQPDHKKERSARDAYIAAMEAQIEKQDQIIQTQEETIRILTKHNDELMEFLDRLFPH